MSVQLKAQSHAKAKPTAGPSEDDRFGPGPIGANAEARIISGNVVAGRMRITIARGSTHGVRVGMEGHVKSAGFAIASFQIDEVKPHASYAFVDATLDQLGANAKAVINPTSAPPRASRDLRSRVLHVSVEGDATRITIARGSDHGIHRGMRGTLVSDSGAEGPDFTVELVDGARSYATVNTTVDVVDAHKQVVLHPITSKRSPIQRRASGNAATADVQATADAGVASASSRLPHFDTIQRAFGKHDISQIQTQVGGPATAASAALGAQAYATGNRVAFASSPDLHTAAHEAAHTIQQRHGAVGFQGLGAADDEHEHHADAVADAVVAGQSAEPLLDKLVGGSPTTAIQRKPAAPRSARFQAVQAILVRIEDVVDGATADTAMTIVSEAKRYLQDALAVVNEAAGELDRTDEKSLALELQRASKALDRVRSVARPHAKQDETALLEMREAEERLRFVLGVDGIANGDEPIAEPTQSKPDIVAAMLDVIAADTARAYSELEHEKDRQTVIGRVSAMTRRNIAFVYTELGRVSEPKQLASRVEEASKHILKMRRWLVGRPAHEPLIAKLQPAIDELDRVREITGLSPLLSMDTPAISQQAFERESVEQAKLKTAVASFDAATLTALEVFKLGVERFEGFAALKRPAPETNALQALLLKALVTVGVNIVTPGLGTFITGFVASGVLKEQTADTLTKTSTKLLSGQVDRVVKKILAKRPDAPDSNEMVRERRYFVETAIESQLLTLGALKAKVHGMIEANQVSAVELAAITSKLDVTSAGLADVAYRETAHGFAMLQAQKGFVRADERDGRKSDDPMTGYLDKDVRGAPRKEGTMGVARLDLRITQRGEDLQVVFNTFQIHGMNDDTAIAVLERAQYQLDRIGLPLEIEMLPPPWAVRNWIDLPFLVIGEGGDARFARNWDAIVESLADRSWKQPRDARLIATPQAAWETIRGAKIDPAIVLRTRPGR